MGVTKMLVLALLCATVAHAGSAGEGEHGTLAIGPGHQCAAQAELRIAQRAEQGAGTTEAQSDAETAAYGQGGQRRFVVERGRRAVGGHPRDSSSS